MAKPTTLTKQHKAKLTPTKKEEDLLNVTVGHAIVSKLRLVGRVESIREDRWEG